MGRIVTDVKKLDLDKVIVDPELYPRDQWSFQTAYGYSQAMLSGTTFPNIVVALYKGKYYLVDGKHRIEAVKILKQSKITAEIVSGLSREKIYEEAVRRNVSHGKALTVHEKRVIALKLRNWKYDKNQISELIQVPAEKLDTFIAQRLVNAITGKVIAEGTKDEQYETKQMIVKSVIKNASETNLTCSDIEDVQKGVYSGNQASMLRQVISIIQAGLLDLDNKEVAKLATELRTLLDNKL